MLDDIETEAKTLTRSVLRHRPIAPDALNTQIQTPRASRVRQKPKSHAHDDRAFASPPLTHAPRRTRDAGSHTWLIYVVLGMLCACLLLWLGQIVLNWGQNLSDDLRYGRPRTTNVDHFVGHETGHIATHFVALNLSGQVYIIEIPGGTNTSQLLVGPRLIGTDSDLAPVSLSFSGDPQHPDLLASIQNIQMRFHNTGSAYVATP